VSHASENHPGTGRVWPPDLSPGPSPPRSEPMPSPQASSLAPAPVRSRTRRAALGIAALVTISLGLGIRAFVDAAWAGPVGDALYAVLVYLLIAFLVPRKPQTPVAAVALTLCLLIELFQLTGLPADLAQSWPPVRLVLGTTFGLTDLVAYTGRCILAYVLDRTLGNTIKSD